MLRGAQYPSLLKNFCFKTFLPIMLCPPITSWIFPFLLKAIICRSGFTFKVFQFFVISFDILGTVQGHSISLEDSFELNRSSLLKVLNFVNCFFNNNSKQPLSSNCLLLLCNVFHIQLVLNKLFSLATLGSK